MHIQYRHTIIFSVGYPILRICDIIVTVNVMAYNMNGCLIILILYTQFMQPSCLHPSSRNSPVVFIFWISIITVIIIITNDMSFVFTGHILHAFPTILIPVKTYTMAVNSENLTHFMYLLYDRMLSFVVGLSCVRKYADLLFS